MSLSPCQPALLARIQSHQNDISQFNISLLRPFSNISGFSQVWTRVVPGPDVNVSQRHPTGCFFLYFIFYHCLPLLLCPKAGGMICFVWLSFKRISSFLFFLRLWISFPWSRVVTGPAVSVFLSANYSFQHPMLAKMSCLHPCTLQSTSLSLHPWYWCQTWYKESIITNSQVSKMPKLENLTKRHIHQGKYEI